MYGYSTKLGTNNILNHSAFEFGKNKKDENKIHQRDSTIPQSDPELPLILILPVLHGARLHRYISDPETMKSEEYLSEYT